ncbi:hypothetical protein M426DRAFT_54290 [Hypoxylon sp. CI-4A]|nr:hypothetical protein M426DRAFT_54290 [Hypoxylon sp. CI-4A]
MDSNDSDGGGASLQTRIPQLPSFSRAFEPLMRNESTEISQSSTHHNSFFTPSYLRGSHFMQKLEEAHKEKQTQQEAQGRFRGGSLSRPASVGTNKMPAFHRGLSLDIIERAPPTDDDPFAPHLPTKWDNNDKHGSLEVLADGLEVRYAASRTSREQDHETCSIRSDHPMPWQAGIYYFEVTVLSRRRDETSVCIGFSTKNVPLIRPPGWEPESWGFHGDDGDLYSGANVGRSYEGQGFGPGDTIGCGINFRTREAFFTKNGQEFKTAFRDIKGEALYPSVGMKKAGEQIRVNFGQSRFIFDIDGRVKREQAKIKAEINKSSVARLTHPPMGETDLIQQLVLQFLQHDGYVETARAFAEEIHAERQSLQIDQTPVPDIDIKDDEDAHHRQRIRRAILEGDIEKAVKYTQVYYPNVLKENHDVYFRLRCRAFIELVRKSTELGNSHGSKRNGHQLDDMPSRMDIDENGFSDRMEEDGVDSDIDLDKKIIEYGKSLQEDFKNDSRPETVKTLKEVFSLVAYANPLEIQAVAALLDRKGRVTVAEELNSAILSSLGKSSRSALENLYGQTSVLLDYLREEGGPGALVTIQSVVDEIPKSQPF